MNDCSYDYIDYKERIIMKKTYKIDVDCANCANKMEEAAKVTEGVKDAVVNFILFCSFHFSIINRPPAGL